MEKDLLWRNAIPPPVKPRIPGRPPAPFAAPRGETWVKLGRQRPAVSEASPGGNQDHVALGFSGTSWVQWRVRRRSNDFSMFHLNF